MTRPLVSIVLATYQRAHLLARSLRAYANHDFDNSRLELVVICDHSTDGTRELVLDWSRSTGIVSTVLTTAPKPDAWRDCGAILNTGIRTSAGEHILLTHPEVIPGRRTVAALVEKLAAFERFRKGGFAWNKCKDWDIDPGRMTPMPLGLYSASKIYYLSAAEQLAIDTVDWRTDLLNVRKLPDFYKPVEGGNPDYAHAVTDLVGTSGYRIPVWRSWVFGGSSRETWKRMGGMFVSKLWGSVDVLYAHRRSKLGMVEWTPADDDTICVHQCHDLPGDVKTDRNMEAWQRECEGIDKTRLAHPETDELGW